jgi:hypothetical protein
MCIPLSFSFLNGIYYCGYPTSAIVLCTVFVFVVDITKVIDFNQSY